MYCPCRCDCSAGPHKMPSPSAVCPPLVKNNGYLKTWWSLLLFLILLRRIYAVWKQPAQLGRVKSCTVQKSTFLSVLFFTCIEKTHKKRQKIRCRSSTWTEWKTIMAIKPRKPRGRAMPTSCTGALLGSGTNTTKNSYDFSQHNLFLIELIDKKQITFSTQDHQIFWLTFLLKSLDTGTAVLWLLSTFYFSGILHFAR